MSRSPCRFLPLQWEMKQGSVLFQKSSNCARLFDCPIEHQMCWLVSRHDSVTRWCPEACSKASEIEAMKKELEGESVTGTVC